MKLSVEAKVAAAVAAGFIALTVAAIGQGGSEAQSGGANNYGLTENSRADMRMREQAYNSSLPGDTVSEQDVAGTTSTKHTKSKIGKPERHYKSQRTQRNR